MDKKIIAIIGIVLTLTLLSLFIPLDNPTGYAISSQAISSQPICLGANLDYSKLTGSIAKCNQYKTQIEQEMQNNQLNVDTLFLFSLIDQESSCRNAEELLASNSLTWAGGLMQVDYDCLKTITNQDYLNCVKTTTDPKSCYGLYAPNYACDTVEKQIASGVKDFKGKYDNALTAGFSGTDAFSLISFAYNRGQTAANTAIKYNQDGDELVVATAKACSDIYTKSGNGCEYCRLTNNGKDKCTDSGLGARYSENIFNKYEKACKDAGGQLSNYQKPDYDLLNSISGIFTPTPVVSRTTGGYKFNPSFKLIEDFDLGIFLRIEKEVEKITEECSENANKRLCVNNFLSDSAKNPEELKIGPYDTNEFAIFNLAEQIYLCSNSSTSNTCYCNISLENDLTLYDDLKIIEYNGNIVFEKKFQGKTISYPISLDKELINTIKTGNIIFKNNIVDRNINKNIYLQKTSSGYQILDSVVNLPQTCNINQNQYVLSKKQDRKYVYYDEGLGRYTINSQDIEFAITLSDTTPPQKLTFGLEGLKFEDKKILITFKKSLDEDTVNYYLFYSKQDFTNKDVKKAVGGQDLLVSYINLFTQAQNNTYDSYERLQPSCDNIDFSNGVNYCDINASLKKAGVFVSVNMSLNTTYNFSDYDEFAAVLKLAEGDYYFTVLAMDGSNNILGFDNAEMKRVKVTNNIVPSVIIEPGLDVKRDNSNKLVFNFSKTELKNIDGTLTTDFKNYLIYLKDKSKLSSPYGFDLKTEMPDNVEINQNGVFEMPVSYAKACYFVVPVNQDFRVYEKYKEYFSQNDYYKSLFGKLRYTCE